MPQEIQPIIAMALEDAIAKGITGSDAISQHVSMFVDVALKVQRRIEPSLAILSQPVAERRIILPDEVIPQGFQENWDVDSLVRRCKSGFPPLVNFKAPGGEQIDLLLRVKGIDSPSGTLGAGGAEVSYVMTGASAGPMLKIWTSESKDFKIEPLYEDLMAQAKELYRRRDPIKVQQAKVESFRMSPESSMYGGSVEE